MSSPPSDPSSGGGGGGDGGSAVPGTASSNFTLLYIIIAVLVGVILYMAIRYGRSVMSEWRQLQAAAGGGGGEPRAALLGLSSDDIDALPTFTYRARGAAASPLVGGGGGGRRGGGSGKGKGATTVVVECVVCLQELADGDVVRVLPACRHFFHGGCIDLWLRAHSTCPVCRAHPEPDGVRLSDVAVSPPLPQLRRCGLSPERPAAASRVLADILARSPLRGNTTSTTTTTTTGGPITSTSSKSPSSPIQTAINYVQASRSPSPTAYRSLNERWSSSPPPVATHTMPEVVVVRSKSPSPSPPIGGPSWQTSSAAAARGVGVVEGVDASATTSASASAPTQVVALSREGGGSRSKSPSPVPH